MVHSLANFNAADFLKKAETFFTVKPLGTDLETDLRELATAGLSDTAYIAVLPKTRYLLTAKEDAISQAMPNVSERQRQLDVVQLHALVLGQLMGISPEAIAEQDHLHYVRDAHEALEQVTTGQANLALLMNPCTPGSAAGNRLCQAT